MCVWGALEWTALQWMFKHKLSSLLDPSPPSKLITQSITNSVTFVPNPWYTQPNSASISLFDLSPLEQSLLSCVPLSLLKQVLVSLGLTRYPRPSPLQIPACFAGKCSVPLQVTPIHLPGFSAASRHSGPSTLLTSHIPWFLEQKMSISQK